ncbi:gamma-glutamyl-gamma-aminobutyraldehyde dehydrogenase [Escherichia coli]|nr:gamma-glutamyl-gamma-aminobutyraldehyde dehydrogenase [Escherichia coli]
MNFHHLAYWQDKALSLAIENRLFINGEYTAAAENETFETVDPVTQAPLGENCPRQERRYRPCDERSTRRI